MKLYLLVMSFLGVLMPNLVSSASALDGNYWQCTTEDKTLKQWTAKSVYQKVAINISFDACKKQSVVPLSCKAAKASCEGYIQGVNTSPMWKCTALDRTAIPWQSNFYSHRLDAALAAKAFCKENSSVPDTCHINLVTCRNVNMFDLGE